MFEVYAYYIDEKNMTQKSLGKFYRRLGATTGKRYEKGYCEMALTLNSSKAFKDNIHPYLYI